MKIIVLGGAGFIGTNLSLSALERGAEVIVFDNLSRKGTDLNWDRLREHGGDRIQLMRGDIREQKDFARLFEAHGDADMIFHLAGQVAVTTSIKAPREDFEINLVGTLNLLEAMREYEVKAPLLYASTNKVYGKMAEVRIVEEEDNYAYQDYPHGIPENYPLNFHSPYGCSKGGADQYVLDYARIYGLNTVVFRQSCIYGYYQFGIEDQGWVAWFTIASLFGLPITIYGDGKQVRDILFIDDLINAYWLAMENIEVTRGKAYNIGGSSFKLSLRQLLNYLRELLQLDVAVDFDAPRQGDQKVFVCDIRKARNEFGWEPKVTPREGVKALAQWAQGNKHLFTQAGIIKA